MEYRNTTQFEDDVKSLSADSKTAIKEESFTNEAKLIARVQQLKLTRDISDWKQAKSYTIVDKNKLKIFYKSDYSKYQDIDLNTQNIPEVWMQLIFALYEANAKYGISLDFSSNATNYFKVKKRDAKEQISLCLGLPTTPKKYDVFTFQTDYDVVIDPQSIGTKQDPSLEQLQQLIKQNKDSNLNKYAAEFRNKADFGGGIPWGLSLALFLPIFQTFYTGEKEASQISGYVMKIEDGHEDNWLTKKLNVTQIDKIYDDAKREIETALKQEKTYKLEDFKDEVTALLDLWDQTKTNPDYKESNQTDAKDNSITDLKRIYTNFRGKYKDTNTVKNLGILRPFTTSSAKDVLVDSATFNPQPFSTSTTFNTVETEWRTRGHIALFLFIIAKITNPSLVTAFENQTDTNKNMTEVAKKLYEVGYTGVSVTFAKAQEDQYTCISDIFKLFDNQFRGAANKLKLLKDRYNNLLTEYNAANTKMTTSGYQRQYPLPKQNLDAAKALVDSLNESNVLAQESAVDAKLKQVEKDAGLWKASLTSADLEHTRIKTLQKNLDDLKAEWANLKTDYQKEALIAYAESDPVWPVLQTVIDASDFAKEVDTFNQTLQDIHNNKIKTLQLEIEKLKEDADKLPLVDSTRFDIPNFTKKTELINYFTKNSNPFQGVNTNIDPAWIEDIAKDNKRLTGLLHAIWGQENNNSQAVVRGLNMAIL